MQVFNLAQIQSLAWKTTAERTHNEGIMKCVCIPLLVVNSMSLALDDCTKDSEIIIGVKAKSQPYLQENKR